MYLRRVSLAVLVAALAAGCESHFLDPELAGLWGGSDLEVRIEAGRVTSRQLCNTVATFPGDVRLSQSNDFQRVGRVRVGGRFRSVVLVAWLPHPDTMRAQVYTPDPLADPAPPVTLVRGQPGTFDHRLVLCVG